MEGEKWNLLDEGISKARVILDGRPVNAVFSPEEYMTYYDCVYCLCCLGYQQKLRDFVKKALEEIIVTKVWPSVKDKDGASLVTYILHLWTNYKIMTKCLKGFFHYLDRTAVEQNTGPLLSDVSFCSFHGLVVEVLHKRLINATVFLITQDRNGVPIDRKLLQGISRFYIEVGEKGNTPYYLMFEEAILADAATYYSEVASHWYPCHSSSDYVIKVEMCLTEESRRASEFLFQSSVEKLLQIIHSQMLVQYADKLSEKQDSENMNSMLYQDIISKCSSMHLG